MAKTGYRVECKGTARGGCSWYVTYPSGRKVKKSKTDIIRLKIRSKNQLDKQQQRAVARSLKAGVQHGRKQVPHRKVGYECGSADAKGRRRYKIECIMTPAGACKLYCNGKAISRKALLDLAGPEKSSARSGMKRRITNAKKRASGRMVRQGAAYLQGRKPRKYVAKKRPFEKWGSYMKFAAVAREMGKVSHINGVGKGRASRQAVALGQMYTALSSADKAALKTATTKAAVKNIVEKSKLPPTMKPEWFAGWGEGPQPIVPPPKEKAELKPEWFAGWGEGPQPIGAAVPNEARRRRALGLNPKAKGQVLLGAMEKVIAKGSKTNLGDPDKARVALEVIILQGLDGNCIHKAKSVNELENTVKKISRTVYDAIDDERKARLARDWQLYLRGGTSGHDIRAAMEETIGMALGPEEFTAMWQQDGIEC